MALPVLGLEQPRVVEGGAVRPTIEHRAARRRILAHQPGDASAQLEEPDGALARIIEHGGEIGLHRSEIGVVGVERLAEVLENGDLEATRIENFDRGLSGFARCELAEFGEIAPQKWKIEIGCDAVAICQTKLKELFDGAARHDDRNPSERITKLILMHEATDRID